MKQKLTNYKLGALVSLLKFAVIDAKNGHDSARLAIERIIPKIESELQIDSRYKGVSFRNEWPSLKAKAEEVL